MQAIATQRAVAAPHYSSFQRRAHWLKRYYVIRAAASVVWIALALMVGKAQPVAGAILFIAYPLWDSLANYIDARRSGGLGANPTQLLNVVVSAIVAVAVAVALTRDVYAATAVIGVWAGLAGILQLATGARRWRKASAQWPQILSGAQSCFASTHFVGNALHRAPGTTVASIWPYAAFGALYFALSAGVLAYKQR